MSLCAKTKRWLKANGDISLAGTSKFLNQVGDFTNNLALRYMSGGEITGEEYESVVLSVLRHYLIRKISEDAEHPLSIILKGGLELT